MVRHWLGAISVAILCAAPREASGQAKVPPPQARLTTRSGVYSPVQADRGSDVYAGYCKSCHSALTHTGPTFWATWNGRALSDLYSYMKETMPKNDPGSLSEQEYADVLAYVLKMNRLLAGKAELPPDSMQLSKIRISIPKSP